MAGPDGKPLPSAVYDTVNRSKKHAVLDLQAQAKDGQPSGLDRLLELLKTADVLITNIPSSSQEKLGLTPQRLAKSHPGLVFAHLQAWGNGGTDEGRPGYDLGSFYAATGLARLFSPEGRYHVYPVSFGDLSTGLNLYVAMVFAVLRLRATGIGSSVDSSLYAPGGSGRPI